MWRGRPFLWRVKQIGLVMVVFALVTAACDDGAEEVATDEEVTATGPVTTLAATTQAPTAVETVTLAMSPFQDVISVYVGIDQGFFADEGIEIDIQDAGDFSASNELLVGGHVDLGTSCDPDIILQNGQGIDTTLAFPLFTFAGGALMYDPDRFEFTAFDEFLEQTGDRTEALRRTLVQIEGLTISDPPSNPILEQQIVLAGLDPGNFDIIEMAQPDMVPALISGSVDLMRGGIPQRLAALREGYATLVDQTATPETIIHCGYSAHRSWVNEDMNRAHRFQRSLFKTQRYIVENPDEAFEIISDRLREIGTEVLPDELAGVWNVMEFFPNSIEQFERENLAEDGRFYWRARFQYALDGFVDDGTITDFAVPLEDLYFAERIVNGL